MVLKKIQRLAVILIAIFSLSGCSAPLSLLTYDTEDCGSRFFNGNGNKKDVSVIFFDNENKVDENGSDYCGPDRKKNRKTNTIGSSDCYRIKSGDTELLVDGGYRLDIHASSHINSDYDFRDIDGVMKETQEKILKKMPSFVSNDGVLDYRIVTHADFDHIASLVVTGGVFDAFLGKKQHKKEEKTTSHENQKESKETGQEKKLKQIKYLIDFDSGLVKSLSDSKIDEKKRLIGSSIYQAYVKKREELIKAGTLYCPASALFSDVKKENKDEGRPEKVHNDLNSKKNQGLKESDFILSEDTPNRDGIRFKFTKDSEYGKNKSSPKEKGELKSVTLPNGSSADVEKRKRYYFFFKFGKYELRILYNWHYNYILRQRFDSQDKDQDKDQDKGQDANNISVCFEIVGKGFKFLGLGDLGGNGEDGLLRYYTGTDRLSNVTVFKASHHGSVSNKENSQSLFKCIKPKIIVITGCAIYKNPTWKNSQDDQVFPYLNGKVTRKQELFDNISSAFGKGETLPMIRCTNILSYVNGYFESAPFYGDIKIRYSYPRIHVSRSYQGKISAYVSKERSCEFKTRKRKKILSLQDTDWFKKVKFTYDNKEEKTK